MLFVFCPWNSEEFRARVAAAKLMNILWAKDPGGFKKSWRTMKKGFPHGCLGVFFLGGMKHYPPVMWGFQYCHYKDPYEATRIQWKVSEVFFRGAGEYLYS